MLSKLQYTTIPRNNTDTNSVSIIVPFLQFFVHL